MADATQRDRAFDVARGIAIVAIVAGHVLRGLTAAEMVPRTSPTVLEVDDALYAWHLTVFAVLVGVFLRPGVERHGVGGYLRSRLPLFVYLYLVWTLVQALARFLTGRSGDGEEAVDNVFTALLVADGPLWWLGFLVLVSVAGALARPWVSRRRAVLSSIVVAAVTLATWGWTGPWLFMEGLALTSFFWVGVLLGRDRVSRLTTAPVAALVAVTGIAAGAALLALADPMPPSSWIGPRTVPAVVLGIITSTLLCAGVLGLSGLLARTALVRPLGFLGERSLEIFLA
ncbi:MAG: acyltransferase family protein, partial [Nocardioides sp.]